MKGFGKDEGASGKLTTRPNRTEGGRGGELDGRGGGLGWTTMADSGGGPISAGERPNRGRGGAEKMEDKMDQGLGGSGREVWRRGGDGMTGTVSGGARVCLLRSRLRSRREEGE